MRLGLTQKEAICLTLLETIASTPQTNAGLQRELQDTLPLAGVLSEREITLALVNTVLTELEQAGRVVCFDPRDLGERRQLPAVAKQQWTITADGAAELEQLRERARARQLTQTGVQPSPNVSRCSQTKNPNAV